jgi:hypothetical protein
VPVTTDSRHREVDSFSHHCGAYILDSLCGPFQCGTAARPVPLCVNTKIEATEHGVQAFSPVLAYLGNVLSTI